MSAALVYGKILEITHKIRRVKMNFKKITVGLFAAVMAMTSVCFADNETPQTTTLPENEPAQDVTTTTEQSQWQDNPQTTTTAQTWETTTWGTTTSYVADTPTSTPTVIKLVVSEVKDKKFTAKINIQSDHLISNASISVGYDESLIEFEKCDTNDKAGGMAVDNAFAGKFVYNYVNADGTDFDGNYATLHFKVADEKLTSTVLYLTVNSLDDENLNAISNQVENGIVKYKDAAESESDDSNYIEIDVDYSKDPIDPADMGLTDVDSVTVANGEVLIFEDGKFQTMSTGETKIDITYKDGSVGHFKVVIKDPEVSKVESSEADNSSKIAAAPTEEKSSGISMGILIAIVCVLCVAVVATEYVMIVRKKSVGKKKSDDTENEEEEDIGEEPEKSDEETETAEENADDTDEDTVDFEENYDYEEVTDDDSDK